ncbi:rifin PIR protein, putative [Plasmodium reichenowi]|uniref:Rifin PIR protein, putative n=1 Tax=Plasmodium reichenowi TaxID=5854 RepID=A0A2P9D3W7_PLARE|nr:rifin PIR protein, putative [Plasmodium reichenowi]
MKLHYFKIFLFFFPLNILLTSSSYAHNKNKPHTTPRHTPIYTSRVLSECDIELSSYDKDEDIKCVKENFDRQTSQRFEEYEERMKNKRQKRKEERDKNIQKIIEKDKMEKSLTEKVEKGCLMCGCALGGGVLPVWGLVSGLWYATWSQYVTKMATDAGIQKGISTVVSELKVVANQFASSPIDISRMINAETYRSAQSLTTSIYGEIQKVCEGNVVQEQVCTSLRPSNNPLWFKSDVLEATRRGIAAAKSTEAAEIAAEHAKSTYLYSAIGYSFLAILIIVLVMIMIYLILRYRRKKKMNKKAQYTKLLNQ